MDMIQRLEAMLAKGQDGVLLRYSLGNAYFKKGEPEQAYPHLHKALALDPYYSAAWSVYAQTLTKLERHEEAIEAYEKGIRVAEQKGDLQAAKMMKVFLNRLQKGSSKPVDGR